jgi:hypothetical protein
MCVCVCARARVGVRALARACVCENVKYKAANLDVRLHSFFN